MFWPWSGGRDYALSQFNRATQAERQTGSSFKPYVYTAAIEDGARPGDIIVDAPVSFAGYIPHNYEGDYRGAMTLTTAFAESRNIPALKLAARVGIRKVIDVAHRFGVTTNIPAYLPVALGAVEITLEEQVAAYSVFPNDGLRVKPRLIRKVSNADGITLWEDPPAVNEVIDQPTARTMMTLLRAVTQHGTGAAAAQLNHPLGGKTGTTSDFTDAWFLGFSPSVTCGVWVGFDSNQSLGKKETGARAALPIWMTFMRSAIAGKDDEQFLGDEKQCPNSRRQSTCPSRVSGRRDRRQAVFASGSGSGSTWARGRKSSVGAGIRRSRQFRQGHCSRQEACGPGAPGYTRKIPGSTRPQTAGQAGSACAARAGQTRARRSTRPGLHPIESVFEKEDTCS